MMDVEQILLNLRRLADKADRYGWNAERDELHEAARYIHEQSCWQDIASAPKDGTPVLLYAEDFGRRLWGRGYYFRSGPDGDGEEGWVTSTFYSEPKDDFRGCMCNPTHWITLPPAPPPEPR